MNNVTGFAAPAIVFLATLASGLWLSHTGRPLNTAIFTVHKLIALAAVIATARPAYTALKTSGSAGVPALLLGAAGIGVVALFVTGALMSMNRSAYGVLRTVHNIAPATVIVGVTLAMYLLNQSTS